MKPLKLDMDNMEGDFFDRFPVIGHCGTLKRLSFLLAAEPPDAP